MADKIRVLIVDDIAETRENIRRLLQFERDMEVVGGARTGKEAISLAQESKPHVVIMDINMPDMDGITATEALLKELPPPTLSIMSKMLISLYFSLYHFTFPYSIFQDDL